MEFVVPYSWENIQGQCFSIVDNNGKHNNLIWIKTFDKSPQSIAYLCHELQHYLDNMIKARDLGKDDTELRADFMSYWIRVILEIIF
jgi:hypothetical protein